MIFPDLKLYEPFVIVCDLLLYFQCGKILRVIKFLSDDCRLKTRVRVYDALVILELALEILREGIVDVLKQNHDAEPEEKFFFKQEGDVLAPVPVLKLVINSQVELEIIAHDFKVTHVAVSDFLGLL